MKLELNWPNQVSETVLINCLDSKKGHGPTFTFGTYL